MLTPLLSCARDLLEDRLSARELFTRTGVDLLLAQVPGTRDPFGTPYPAYMMEATATRDGAGLAARMEEFLAEATERGLITDALPALDHPQAQALWALREALPEAEKRSGGAVKHDVGLPLSAVADFVTAAERRLTDRHSELSVNVFGHVGDGNVHFNVLAAQGIDRVEVSALVHQVVAEFGGSISGEHGIGVFKADALVAAKSPVELALLRTVKDALDPQGIMNPGKMLLSWA
ncbi:FAD/FMN-containing dehydrogenase [Kitasatospora sp. MAA4]|uniref:FAD-binding oxidoreductase n=1 Tax=Kitasatospora sp. MAA4 TaxID=3035093 RepID=UPI0024770750|nr:FAD-linked oxidase C-terminal domain-containing protein [Kitasatospora sp. MAA4]MDH6136782.1 FAD/FMN-containing dehydrogenase [Kitasatospora sp. MAA4]